jgi:hypothetical protein
MPAINPTFRPAHLLLIASLALLGASAPAAAQTLDFARSVRSATAWLEDLGRWLVPPGEPTPPESGMCIDPNGKPKPCDGAEEPPPGARRDAARVAPRG